MSKKKARVKVFLPDAHFGVKPDREAARALECATRVIEFLKPDEVIHLGDLLDCAAFSSHAKKTLKDAEEDSYFEDEVYPAQVWFDRLQKSCGHLHLIEGNHEFRIERFITQNFTGRLAKEMFDLLDPMTQMSYRADGAKRKNYSFTKYAGGGAQRYRVNPTLYATHGYYHGSNVAKKHLAAMPAGVSVFFGHIHARHEATKRCPFSGKLSFGVCPGSLTNLHQSYRHGPTQDSHGIIVLYESRTKSSDWTHYSVTIQNGRCILPCGTEIKA